MRRRLIDGAVRECARLLLTEERAEEAMLALKVVLEGKVERSRGVVYARSDHPVRVRGTAGGVCKLGRGGKEGAEGCWSTRGNAGTQAICTERWQCEQESE